jgi:hypothetical protein
MKFPCTKYARYFITAVLSAIIAAGLFVHIKVYTMNRSFHLDEAMFAESIITRNFSQLAAEPLLNDQTAPILYLYMVKLLSVFFGPTENALRIFSLFTFLGVLVLAAILLKKAFTVNNAIILLGISIIATLGIYMRYANELKPYMSDTFFVLLILFLYHLYNTGKIKLPILTSLYCIAILFSSPALFFAASVFIFEFIRTLKNRNIKQTGKVTMAGLSLLAYFIIYYILWLMPVAESDYMIDFWKDHRFYLIPTSKEHIIGNILNMARIFRRFGLLFFFYPVLFLAGLTLSLRQRNRVTCVAALSAGLLLIASQIEKYPMEPRLYMFAYALIILYTSVFIDRAVKKYTGRKLALGCLCLLSAMLVLNNFDFTRYAVDRVYIETHEVNPLIDYVRENIGDGEYLYSSSTANYVLRFKNGYNTNRIGDVSQDNILYGGGDNDVERILNTQKAYLLFQRTPPASFLEELKARGFLHEVGSYYLTPLYYFSTDGDDPKLQALFEGRNFLDDIAVIFKFTIKNFLEISVKSDDATDKLIIHVSTFRHGRKILHEYFINRP